MRQAGLYFCLYSGLPRDTASHLHSSSLPLIFLGAALPPLPLFHLVSLFCSTSLLQLACVCARACFLSFSLPPMIENRSKTGSSDRKKAASAVVGVLCLHIMTMYMTTVNPESSPQVKILTQHHMYLPYVYVYLLTSGPNSRWLVVGTAEIFIQCKAVPFFLLLSLFFQATEQVK